MRRSHEFWVMKLGVTRGSNVSLCVDLGGPVWRTVYGHPPNALGILRRSARVGIRPSNSL